MAAILRGCLPFYLGKHGYQPQRSNRFCVIKVRNAIFLVNCGCGSVFSYKYGVYSGSDRNM